MFTKCIEKRAKKKAMKMALGANTVQKYFIVAIGISKKGNVVEIAINKPACKPGNRYYHAEGYLMVKYGRKLKRIIIFRFGRSGERRPIEPCIACLSIAKRLDITIEAV